MYTAGMSLTALSRSVLTTDGQDVDLVSATPELTVPQAAEFLRTSERHLNDLLDAERIVCRWEGGLRLVRLDSLLEFEQWRERGHAAVDRMMRWNQEMGLYDD